MFRFFFVVGLLAFVLGPSPLPADSGDPPELVGRVAFVEGSVVLIPEAGEDAVSSPANYPLAAGAVLRSSADGRAEFELAGVRFWLGGDSQVVLVAVDAEALRFDLRVGSLRVRIDEPGLRLPLEIVAGETRIDFHRAGRYRVDRDGATTSVQVSGGLARVEAGATLAYLTDGQRVVTSFGALGLPENRADGVDDFERWAALRETQADRAAAAPRYVPTSVPGWRDLDAYGSWEQSADYGPMWTPTWVPAGWAPYRNGNWVWFSTWGWTWVDHAPWGFAPFHFGRWTLHRDRWCWVPGKIGPRPAFAPALVSIHVGTGGRHSRAERPHRWAPLAPHEKFVPAFRASARFADRINGPHAHWQGRGDRTDHVNHVNHEAPVRPVASPAFTVRGGELNVRQWQRRERSPGAMPVARPAAAMPPPIFDSDRRSMHRGALPGGRSRVHAGETGAVVPSSPAAVMPMPAPAFRPREDRRSSGFEMRRPEPVVVRPAPVGEVRARDERGGRGDFAGRPDGGTRGSSPGSFAPAAGGPQRFGAPPVWHVPAPVAPAIPASKSGSGSWGRDDDDHRGRGGGGRSFDRGRGGRF